VLTVRSLFGYGLLNLQILAKHQDRIRQLLADKASDLKWLRHFVYAPLIIAGLWFAFTSA